MVTATLAAPGRGIDSDLPLDLRSRLLVPEGVSPVLSKDVHGYPMVEISIDHYQVICQFDSGIGSINAFNSADMACRIAGQIPKGNRIDHQLNMDEWLSPASQLQMGRFSQLALVATAQAMGDSGWVPATDEESYATGVCIGSGCGGMEAICCSC